MKKFLKPGLSIILIVVFALCTPIFSSAKTNAFLPNDNLIIPEPAAIKFAEYFVRDMVLSKQTKWNSDVHVVDVVPTYDETGEKLTSYFVELSKGYVTISAYIDMPNLVLEWSDELKPSYHNFGERNNAKIIYMVQWIFI